MKAFARVAVFITLALICCPLRAKGGDDLPARPGVSVPDVVAAVEKLQKDASATGLSTPLKIVLFTTLLSILPAMLIMSTAFTRIIIVLAFLRRALTTQNIPPNTVLIGLALFLTFFVMGPTFEKMGREAIVPYTEGRIGAVEALRRSFGPLREFMLGQTGREELEMFVSMSGMDALPDPRAVPTRVLIPAFVTSELKKAFQMGFMLFLPFVMVDLIVAAVLLSMGMMMLPPVMVSMPLKILLFVLVNGWELLVEALMMSFAGGGT